MLIRMIKSFLPPRFVQLIKSLLTRLKLLTVRICASNGFLASVYYSFFSRQFYREHKAMLLALLEFSRRVKRPRKSSARLRRNIHRLEKGLIMRPRRPVFAEAYISETLDAYKAALGSESFCTQELSWATDVLAQYFAVVNDNPVIAKARQEFSRLTAQIKMNGEAVPYAHQMLPENPVSYDALHALFRRRRSVRWFKQTAVAPELVQQAVAAASLAPTACNRQPYQFYVINNAQKAAEVAKYAMGTVGFADNIPCLVVVVGDLSAYEAERDRHVIYIDAALASMQLMLALETLGLQSCPINWPDVEILERKMADTLNLAYWQRPVMLLAIGYAQPSGGIAYSQKKHADMLIKEID
uniref:Nitroreductase family protein n=1 Tax=Rheinheimera sp. BAL341 TaxID=1708203 RepID=A0A486XXY9_9GAMM